MQSTLLIWETSGRLTAELAPHGAGQAISISQANDVVYSLMHDVALLMADFDGNEIGFERVFQVSLFQRTSAEFFGLYRSSGDEQPDWCLRRMQWTKNFSTLDKLLDGVSSESLFFSVSEVDPGAQRILEELTETIVSEGEIVRCSEPRESDATINYSLVMHGRASRQSYRFNQFENVRIETWREHLASLFFDLKQGTSAFITPTSIKIRYQSNGFHSILKSLGAEG